MAITSSSTTFYHLHFANSSPSPFLPRCSVPFKHRPEKIQKGEMITSVFNGGDMRLRSLKGSGPGVLERPGIDPSLGAAVPLVEEGGDIGRSTEKIGTGSGDSYKVLLVDDPRHSEKLVEKVLPQVVPSVTPDQARKIFYISRERGVAIVIVTVKEHAEFYAQMMIRQGLRSAIEPDSALEM